MKDIIQKSINRIHNIEERVVFKELMEEVFWEFYVKNTEMYEALEKRVLNETVYDVDQYVIQTGIIERKYFDSSHHSLTPILQEDMEAPVLDMGELKLRLSEKDNTIMKVFFQCDYQTLQKLMKQKRTFSGVIKTNKNEYSSKFYLEWNRDYTEEIYKLYLVFLKNGIPWKTVNAPYLSRMINIVIGNLPDGIGDKENITEIDIDFQEYASFIRYDYIPVWNVRQLLLESQGFPVPCEDHRNYEYTISIRNQGEENVYLVADEDLSIQHIRRKGDQLFITSMESKSKLWKVLMINPFQDKRIDQYTYPIFSNGRRDGFMERYQRKNAITIKTEAELIRYIEGFGLKDYIELTKYRIVDRQPQEESVTYSMNPFLVNEIRDVDAKKSLVLTFQATEKDSYLAIDIASFLVSEIQVLFPEYDCKGIV